MSEADFQPLIEWLRTNPSWLLFSIFLISFIESLALAGIIVPGVLLLFLVASVAGHLDFAISAVLLSGFLGAVLGDGISFYLGRYFKTSIPNLWPFSRYPKTLKMGENFFHKHGGKSVMLGRFIGPIRPVLPLVAGMLGMSQLRFALFNSSSALIWAPFYLLPGYFTGQATSWHLPSDFIVILAIFLAVLILFSWFFRFLSLRLQKGSPVYDALLLSQESNVALKSVQQHYLRFRQRHPTFEFPLASLTLLFIATSIFIVWSYLAVSTNMLSAINQSCLDIATSLRLETGYIGTVFSAVQVSFTLLGDEAFLYLSFSFFIVLMLWRKQYYAALHLVCAGLLTAILTHLLKDFFAIPRPELTFAPPSSFAYPSGHSSGATVFYALLATFIAQDMAKLQRWKCYIGFALPIVFIAFSRVFLGVHWFSDIVGGVSLGLVISSLTRVSYSYYHFKDANRAAKISNDKIRIMLFIFLWLVCLIAYQWAVFSEVLNAVSIIEQD
ncbi:MAG: bifunctional DedA family/phosphatase PAP2 family protein [Oleiphilus sp.]